MHSDHVSTSREPPECVVDKSAGSLNYPGHLPSLLNRLFLTRAHRSQDPTVCHSPQGGSAWGEVLRFPRLFPNKLWTSYLQRGSTESKLRIPSPDLLLTLWLDHDHVAHRLPNIIDECDRHLLTRDFWSALMVDAANLARVKRLIGLLGGVKVCTTIFFSALTLSPRLYRPLLGCAWFYFLPTSSTVHSLSVSSDASGTFSAGRRSSASPTPLDGWGICACRSTVLYIPGHDFLPRLSRSLAPLFAVKTSIISFLVSTHSTTYTSH